MVAALPLHSLCVSSDLALHPPRRDVPAVQLESGNPTSGLDVALLVVAHVLLYDGHDVVLSRENGAFREGKKLVRALVWAVHCTSKPVVDPDGGSEIYSGVRSAGTAELGDLQVPP